MTDAELRIIEFLITSHATRPADLPDWMLALFEGDCPDQLSHELITAASLIYRTYPAIVGTLSPQFWSMLVELGKIPRPW